MLRSSNKLLELTALLFIAYPAYALDTTSTNNESIDVAFVKATSPKTLLLLPDDKNAVDPLADIIEKLDYSSPLYTGEEVDVWGRIRKGFAIPDLDNELVAKQLAWYTARPDYIDRTTKRASLYLYHVVQELEKRHMPTELALLPFIESAFNPNAVSVAQAAGMWQFVPGTGRDYKLKQNMFRDDRRSVIQSTDAALSYLQRLYGMFGDWQLALAAYNWGEGSVQRAIKKSQAAGGGTDFTSLSPYMPAETRNYVPKLQAVKNIIAHPEIYGLQLTKVDNQPYFTAVPKTRDIDITVAAKLAEMPVNEFKALNPQFSKPVITGSGSTQILLPKSNAEKFKENISKWTQTLSSWTSHTVVSAKEKIETIAARFKTTPKVIRDVNNIPPKMSVRAGSTILVPKVEDGADKDISPDIADGARIMMVADTPDTKRIFIKVGKRDTIESIAKRYRVSTDKIVEWNNLEDERVKRGQKLHVEVPFKAKALSISNEEAAEPKTKSRYKSRYGSSKTSKTKIADDDDESQATSQKNNRVSSKNTNGKEVLISRKNTDKDDDEKISVRKTISKSAAHKRKRRHRDDN